MTNQHPITPPPELVQQLYGLPQMRAIEKAFEAGADQELEACCEWLVSKLTFREDGIRFADELRAARRPNPPSLKEQALKALDGLTLPDDAFETIRFALDQLDD